MLKALHSMRIVSLHPDVHCLQPEAVSDGRSARLSRTISILDDIHWRGEEALILIEYRAVQAVLLEALQVRYLALGPLCHQQ